MTKHGEAISPISAPFPTPSTHIATTTLEPSCLWPVDLSARGCMEITPGSGASFLSSVAVKLHYTYRSSPQLSVCLSSFICLFLLSLDSGASTCFSSLFFFFILNVCVLVKFVCLFCFSFMCCLSWLLISFKCVMKQSFEQQRGLCLRPSPRSETRLRTLTKRKDTNYLTAFPGSWLLDQFVPFFCFAAFHVPRLEDWRCGESLLFWCGLFDEPVIC